MSFFWSQRLGASASPDLMHYYAEIMKEPDFLRAVHDYDRAQLVMLARADLAPGPTLQRLARALRQMEEEGVVEARLQLSNVIHGGEEFLRQVCGPESASLLHLGRSSPSIRAVASRLSARRRILGVQIALVEVRRAVLALAADHLETYMPGYSYLQHIDLTTLGYYLLSWGAALERDAQRLYDSYQVVNVSVVGSDGGFGTPYHVALEQLDQLLGFPRPCLNARDGIRNYDYLIQTLAGLAILDTTLARLATDLLVWSTSEFGFVRIPGQLSITSSVAPHMRIPYVLEFLCGLAAVGAGGLMEGLSAVKAPSEQLEAATLLPLQVLRQSDEANRALRVLRELMVHLEVDEARLRRAADSSSAVVGGVLAWLIGERGVPYRDAHGAIAEFQRDREGQGRAGQALDTHDLSALSARLQPLLDSGKGSDVAALEARTRVPAVVASHALRGGTSTARTREQLEAARSALERDAALVETALADDERAAAQLANGLAQLAAG